MANAEDLSIIWQEGGFIPPSKIFAVVLIPIEDFSGNFSWVQETMIVVSDDSSIFVFMDFAGKVYYVSHSRCTIQNGFYQCEGPLYSADCNSEDNRTRFARQQIAPLFYTLNQS
nr:hypothetical protein pmam_169 [Pithovirus mammoth]